MTAEYSGLQIAKLSKSDPKKTDSAKHRSCKLIYPNMSKCCKNVTQTQYTQMLTDLKQAVHRVILER